MNANSKGASKSDQPAVTVPLAGANISQTCALIKEEAKRCILLASTPRRGTIGDFDSTVQLLDTQSHRWRHPLHKEVPDNGTDAFPSR